MPISFLFLHENLCCVYSLEAPRWGASNEYPQNTFSWRNKKNIMWIPPLICSYVSGCGKDLNTLLECCLSEISHPRHIKIIPHSHIIPAQGWSMLAPYSKCWGPREKAASTIFVCLYWPLPLSGLMQQMITSQHSKTLLFFLFFPEKRIDISCKLLPLETLCMKCQILFSEEKKKI